MTKPKAARAPTAAAATTETPAAVQSILEQLEVYKTEQQTEVVSPFGTVTESPFGVVTASPFGEVATASTAFAAVAEKASEVFGPKGSSAFLTRGSDAFAASRGFQPKAKVGRRRPMPPGRRFVIPPPVGKPKFGRYWLPMCEMLRVYDNGMDMVDHLWFRGETWDFDELAEAMAWGCMEKSYGYQPGHDEDANGLCCHPDHVQLAQAADDFEETLHGCGCIGWDYEEDWEYIVPLMQEIRDIALDHVNLYIHAPSQLDRIHMWAGRSPNELYEMMGKGGSGLKQPIIDAVEEGDHDHGLAAAYADYMARQCPLMFGAVGQEVDEILRQIHEEGCLLDGPKSNLVFEHLRDPLEIRDEGGGWEYAVLHGRYGLNRITYDSALARGSKNTDGAVGWRTLWMVPVNSWEELLVEDGATVLGEGIVMRQIGGSIGNDDPDGCFDDDDDDDDDDGGGSAC